MKCVKKVLIYLLIAILTVTCIPPVNASAAENDNVVETQAAVQSEPADDDGLLLRDPADFAGQVSRARAAAPDSSSLVHNPRFEDAFIEEGIDISHHNGIVDWDKVREDGVDFAIIRMAYRGYGSEGNIAPDNYAVENLKNARAAGLKVGVYFFSQAITKAEAVEEAKYILNMIKGYKVDLPVVMDFEYTAGSEGRLYAADLTNRQRTDICLAFCKTVDAAGYDAMVYANRSMLTNSLYADEIDSEYGIWLAEWGQKAYYEGDYSYWQYTSDGSVNGVPSARVDMNVRYITDPFAVTDKTSSTLTMEWNPVTGADGYIIYRKNSDGEFVQIAQIDDPEKTVYKDRNLKTNTCYVYRVKYYKVNDEGKSVICWTGYPLTSATTLLKLGTVTVKGTVISAGTVKLTWSKEPNADGYVIQKYNSSKGKYETIKSQKAADGRYFYVYDLKFNSSYKFRVKPYAVVSGVTKYGTYSEPVIVKTSASLNQPVLTAKTYSFTSINLSWKKVPGAAGYVIQRYSTDKKKYVTVKTVKGVKNLKYKDTYLNSGLKYTYRVKAYAVKNGKTVYSKASAVKSAKTGPARIGKVKASTLYIRTGPGTSYKKITSVKKGQKITVYGSTKSWYRVKVKVNGKYKKGYAAKSYILLLKSK